LVWSDEFDARDTVNVNQWSFQEYMNGYDDLQIATTSDVAKVTTDDEGNGVLRLTSYYAGTDENGVKQYKTTKSVTTGTDMTYVYGYLEMRAKVPTGQGVWPSFWTKNYDYRRHGETYADELGYNREAEYRAEVDVFEVFGNSQVKPNIHKWSTGDDGAHHDYSLLHNYSGYTIGENEWHTYGFLWTENEMTVSVDGEEVYTYNLNANFGEGDMSAFHEPLCIILNNHLYTAGAPDRVVPTVNGVRQEVTEDFVSADYDIDYIRLYQNESGKLYKVNN